MVRVQKCFKNIDLQSRLSLASEEALKRFNLPPLRLLCFFDDESPEQFDEIMGPRHCGFHVPVIGSGSLWPAYVDDLFINSMGDFEYDNVIYVNGRTTLSVPGTVITLAHELQHFMQYGHARKVWKANTLIYEILRDGPPTPIRSWDIPYEKDTTRVSKKVAEEVLGADVVNTHVNAQIAAGNHTEKWMFFQNVSYAMEFDLLEETKRWVERYRTELLKIDQTDVDFRQSEWWI